MPFTEITLDNLNVVVAGKELDVKRSADMQFLGNLLAHALDAAHCLAIEFLRRELYGGVARVDSGKLDVLTDGIGDNLAVARHGIHLHLLGMLDKLTDNNRMILTHVSCQFEELLKLFLVGAYVHGSTREDVGRTNEDGEAHLVDKLVDVVHRGEGTPCRLVDAVA